MNQGTNYFGQHLFSQIVSLCKRHFIEPVTQSTKANRCYKRLHFYEHFISMLYCTLSGCTSLREIQYGLTLAQGKLNHLGIDYVPPRSTLSDGNKNRPSPCFKALYEYLYVAFKPSLSDSTLSKAILQKLFFMDATVFGLFKAILKTSGRHAANGKRKGGIKKVTRQKENATYTAIAECRQDQSSPDNVLKEEIIEQAYKDENGKECTLQLRRIAWWDDKMGRVFEFITNNFELDAATVALLYKYRWKIELFFKKLKQNFPLQYFVGDNQNAIEIQIWCALIALLLLSKIHHQHKSTMAFSVFTAVLRLHLFNYISIKDLLAAYKPKKASASTQLELFNNE